MSVPVGTRPAVLLFFASWCTACHTEVPAVAALYSHQRADHSPLAAVAVVGVDGNDPGSAASSFVRQSKVTFPVGVDPDYALTEGKFGFLGLPDAVFVNADGTIAGIHQGALSTAELVDWEHRLVSNG